MRCLGFGRRCLTGHGHAYSIRMAAGAGFMRFVARLVGIVRCRNHVGGVQRNAAVDHLSRSIFVALLECFHFRAVRWLARIHLAAETKRPSTQIERRETVWQAQSGQSYLQFCLLLSWHRFLMPSKRRADLVLDKNGITKRWINLQPNKPYDPWLAR